MHDRTSYRLPRGQRAAARLALRIDAGRESRLAMALIALLGLATLSVLASTSAFSHTFSAWRAETLQR